MKDNQEENKSIPFVKRWLKAFNRIRRTFGEKEITDNTKFVDTILKEEEANAKTQEDIDTLAEKRKLLEELCDEVDVYYQKKESIDKADNLEDWFNEEVSTFVHDTIPDANQEDVKEIADNISQSMDKEIKLRASLLESEFMPDESESTESEPVKPNQDE